MSNYWILLMLVPDAIFFEVMKKRKIDEKG